MTAETPDQIVQMALQFTRAASQALSFLELPSKTDGEIFEGLMDQVADNVKLDGYAWQLFAATTRIEFYGNDASKAERKNWSKLADDARDALYAADSRFTAEDEADYRADLARDERMMGAA